MKMSKFKLACQIALIASMFGLGIISLIDHRWKEFGLGILYAMANTIIFIL